MTLYQILNLYIINMVNTSLMAWILNAEDVNYRELTEFFQKEINIQELLKKTWKSIFSITEGWVIIAALKLLSWLRNKMKYKPLYVSFDAGFASKRFLKRIDDYGWVFVCRIPKTRKFEGIQIWRYKKQGFWNNCGILWCDVKVLAVRRKSKFYVCNRLNWNAKIIENCYKQRAVIEEVFRVLKGVCHWKRCQFSKDERYERFLAFGIIAFMVWEFNRIHYPEPITIYKLRRNVIFDNFDLCIPDLAGIINYV